MYTILFAGMTHLLPGTGCVSEHTPDPSKTNQTQYSKRWDFKTHIDINVDIR
jgi:hypothetical protein